ncbi:MAG: methyltransferase domain-containing protein [Acidobacteria bacterium]|nr:methyltransferase domain-containing protein [Acidobacteriota bacterium]
MRHRLLALVLMFVAALAFGCSNYDDSLESETAAEAGHDEDGGEDHGDGEDGDGGDGHGMAGDERAEYSMPDQVYAFLEIAEGQTVVDLLAGGGYNAERVAPVVGTSGTVIAERAQEQFQERAVGGDLSDYNFQFIGDVAELQDGSVDAALAIRAYHLFPDVPVQLGEIFRAMKPGGVVGVVEVRLNEESGHNMETHRLGEQTVIDDFAAAGFEYVEASDILRRDDDDYTVYSLEGQTRYQTDRMLLKFRKPAE